MIQARELADAVAEDASRTALEVRELTGPAGTEIVHDVSLSVPHGGTHLVLGSMHSGKSLLLRLILGLQASERGWVAIDGAAFDPAAPNERELRRVRRCVGVVFDRSALVSRLTVLENVELPLVEHTDLSAAGARDLARERLRDLGIERAIDRTPDELTRLDRRRTALARALVLGPPLLLVDEPGNGLDAHAAAALDDALVRLQEQFGFAMLICSQEVRYAVQAPERISVLAGGEIVERGSFDELRRSDREVVRRLVDRRGDA